MLIRRQNVHFGGLRLTDVAYIDACYGASEMSMVVELRRAMFC